MAKDNLRINQDGTFVLRTRKVSHYFTGKIRFIYPEYHLTCLNYAGGSDIPMLNLIDYRAKIREKMIEKIKKFKRKYKLISTP